MENNVAKMLVEALIHTLATIGKFFLAPYNCWLKAAERLVEQGKNGSVEIRNIDGFWPILVYYKRFCIDFLFDGFDAQIKFFGKFLIPLLNVLIYFASNKKRFELDSKLLDFIVYLFV